MKRLYNLLILSLLVGMVSPVLSQNSKPDFNFYGFVRSDFYYDSRVSAAAFHDIFYLYPLDESLDSQGVDLNDDAASSFFAFITRLGVDISGKKIGSADATAKVEVDFGGYGSYNYLLRLRHAYLNLAWKGGHSLLVGQTWHPLFGTVMPTMCNVSTGAPFQPFSRAPQVRYSYRTGGWNFLVAALSQLQYTSSGPEGTSAQYMMDGCTPELYAGFDYYNGGWQFGGGVDLTTIAPRTESVCNGETYKVDERLTSLSGEVHMRYHNKMWNINAKSILASSLDHMAMLGGYGVTSDDPITGEQEYTPLKNSTSWLNITYGNRWKPSVFVGYTKNLGSSESLVSADKIYGRGTNIDQLLGVNLAMTYNIPNFSVGVEYSTSTAWYGDINLDSGKVENTHDITNNRIVGIVTYFF
ncbi:MAG: DcaP family trimeric outer membrane transporter [Rikenellaceae bacterium]